MNKCSGNILLISPESWNHIFVSKHHYAIELIKKGFNVYFLNPPSTVNDVEVKEVKEFDGLYTIDYFIPLRGQRFLPDFFIRLLDKKLLKRFEDKAKCKFDIIWNFESSRFYNFSFANKNVLKIYHQVDLTENFHLKKASSTADICFCTTEFILNRLKPYNKKTYKIHHGVSQHAFNANSSNQQLSNKKGVTATYIGNLDIPYLDVTLLEKLVKNFPAVQFQFVGTYGKDSVAYNRLSSYSNTVFTGKVASKEIIGYLNNSDLLLVCYKADEYKEQLASPHKMMEYLASGKTIVATYTDEYKDKKDLLLMTHRNEDYMSIFNEAIENLNTYNSPQVQEKRIAFAREHTYKEQVDKIFHLIKENVITSTFS